MSDHSCFVVPDPVAAAVEAAGLSKCPSECIHGRQLGGPPGSAAQHGHVPFLLDCDLYV